MGLTSPRFTIRSLMIAVATIAGLFGLYRLMGQSLLAVSIGLLYIALIGTCWWMFRGLRRLSALCFGTTAVLANITCFFLCISLANLDGLFLIFLVWLTSFPLSLGAGSAWAVKSTSRKVIQRRSPLWVWPMVLGLAILPLTTLITLWPLLKRSGEQNRTRFQFPAGILDVIE